MKLILLATILLAAPAFGQPFVSPQVQPDRRVTFRLWAPDAKKVQVHCEGIQDAPLQRGTNGVWAVTAGPVEPDIYAYSFSVDGVHVLDPANPLQKYNLMNCESLVHVPGPQSLAWEINDVPRGELHEHFYRSQVAADDRNFWVYTPPGYDPKARKRYPVLYLLHGFSDDASAWSTAGRANVILDNLIARGEAKPMLVVMPLGYGNLEIVTGGWSRAGNPQLWQQNVDKFGESLLGEVIPQVEKSYRVSTGRESRAIAGLSMGGTESLVTGLNHPDRFAWIGSFSAGGLSTNYVAQFPALNSAANGKIRLLWIACGKDDHLFAGNQQFCQWLTAQNVERTWVASSGAHTYMVWRRDLAMFAPLLFQDRN